MMPKNKIGRHMMDKLKLCVGPNHPHQAQQPIPLEPLSGRPTPSGAVYAPEPAPKTNGHAAPTPAPARAAASVVEVHPEPALPAPAAEPALPPPATPTEAPATAPESSES